MLLVIVHGEEGVQAKSAKQFAIATGGVNDLQSASGVLKPPGETGEHSHEGAVHARTRSEVNDYPLTSFCCDHFFQHKGFEFAAVLVASFAIDAYPYLAVDTACKDA